MGSIFGFFRFPLTFALPDIKPLILLITPSPRGLSGSMRKSSNTTSTLIFGFCLLTSTKPFASNVLILVFCNSTSRLYLVKELSPFTILFRLPRLY